MYQSKVHMDYLGYDGCPMFAGAEIHGKILRNYSTPGPGVDYPVLARSINSIMIYIDITKSYFWEVQVYL